MKEKELYDVFEPCSDDAAHSAEPKDDITLEMDKIEENLTDRYEVVFSSEIMLLVEDSEKDIEIGFYPSGKILFKSDDGDLVDEIFDDTVEIARKGLID